MTIRKRIQAIVPGSGGTGTPVPPAPGGAIVWDPASGKSDGTQLAGRAGVSLGPISVATNNNLRAGISLPAISASMGVAARAAVGLPDISADMGVRARGQARLQYIVNAMEPNVDFYLDENAPTTNFGSSTLLLAKTNGAVGNNRQYTILAWNFTGISGTVSNASVRLRIDTTLVTGETATYQVWTSATQPYTESTANWNNSNAAVGTQRGSISAAVTNTPAFYTINLDATQMANMPGNWMYLRCLGTAAVGAASIRTTSKETGTGSRPTATFTVDV